MRFSLIIKRCAPLLLLLQAVNFPSIAADSAKQIFNVNTSINSTLFCQCEFGWLLHLESFIGELIDKMRRKFDIIVHFDFESACAVNCALRYSANLDIGYNFSTTQKCPEAKKSTPKTVTLLNYATINMDGISNYKRPKAYAMAHLILLTDPWIYERYSKTDYNILSIDIIYIVSSKLKRVRMPHLDIFGRKVFSASPESSSWTVKNLDRGGGIHIIEARKKDVHYYRTCSYCGNYTHKLFEQWKRPVNDLKKLDTENLIIFSTNTFQNFFNHTFRVGFQSRFSFVMINSTKGYDDFGRSNYRCDPCGGPEGRLMVELANRYNLQFYLYPITFNTKSAEFDVINDIRLNQLDWAIGGLTVTKERRAVVDFTNILSNDPYTFIYYLSDNDWNRATLLIKPFTKWVWLAIVISIVLIWIVIKICIGIPSPSDNMHMQKPFFNIFRILLGQPTTGIVTISMRSIVAIWILVSMILSSMYSTRIASMAIKPETVTSLTLDTAINNNYAFLLSKLDSFLMKSMLGVSDDSKLIKILSESKNDIPFCDAIKHIIDHNAIILDEQTVLWFNYMTTCYGNVSEIDKKRIYMQHKEIFDSYHAWPFSHNTPYLRSFNRFIGLVMQSGIYYKWTEDAMRLIQMERSDIDRYTYYKGFTIGFQLKDIVGEFILLIAGIVISTMCFILEILSKRGQHKILKISRNNSYLGIRTKTKRRRLEYFDSS